ncbi:MAG: Gfo/Idh/MocA family oxidoreductase [Deltaproteobacteria bacterium]|nr:Gfo/Idh/MocA family oxidoreductase [Deltaproteobacteria bacterium]
MTTRRDLLKQLASSALALPLLSTLDACRTASRGPVLRVALLGLGRYAERVADAMQACTRARITGLISGTPAKLASWGAKYGVPESSRYSYETFDAVRDNPEIDAVYILTPNGLHKDQALRVAKAGKHVLCEKPMAVTAAEGQEMIDACRAAQVQLLVGYRLHLEANTLEVIRMRKAGDFGRMLFFQGQCGYRLAAPPTDWRRNRALAGGGALLDVGIYAINGARYLIGEEPRWVTAEETKMDPGRFGPGLDETINFQLGFPSGAVASCLSTHNMDHLDRFFLDGTRGYAELQPAMSYGPIAGHTQVGPLTREHVTHQTVQLDAMADVILHGKQPEVPIDGEEGLRDLKIIDAIYLAARSGRRVDLT